jgi:hypothetical protein
MCIFPDLSTWIMMMMTTVVPIMITTVTRMLVNVTVRNSHVVCIKNVGHKVDHLKFMIDIIEGLLVKYSMQCNVLSCHGDDSSLRVLQNGIFLQEHHIQKRNLSQQDCVVWGKPDKRKETMYCCYDFDLCLDGWVFQGLLYKEQFLM